MASTSIAGIEIESEKFVCRLASVLAFKIDSGRVQILEMPDHSKNSNEFQLGLKTVNHSYLQWLLKEEQQPVFLQIPLGLFAYRGFSISIDYWNYVEL